jgi:DNA repair protein RadA/Sms
VEGQRGVVSHSSPCYNITEQRIWVFSGDDRMSKPKTHYICSECGYESPRWLGRCPDCDSWNTLTEERLPDKRSMRLEGQARAALGDVHAGSPVPISQVGSSDELRRPTGLSEFDRVLGGGLVDGSLVLVSGEPGIGKSTLILQAAYQVAHAGATVLYVSGEESPRQIKMRAQRVNAIHDRLLVLSASSLDLLKDHVAKVAPSLLVVDSIQTLYDPEIPSAPGSVSQVREVTSQLLFLCKQLGIAAFIIGHVTKSGAIAGPRVLEHMVDTVIYFEGDRSHAFRILRAVKNRFGSTNEVGIFEMSEQGLVGVDDASSMFLSDDTRSVPGSAVAASIEGNRPILVEIQALVASSGFGAPRRTVTGVDYNRTAIMLAVLEKRAGLCLSNEDVYVSAAGGVRMSEPASDLAITLALASSFRNRPVVGGTVAIGEVGLAGELRAVSRPEVRVAEAARMGFTRCLLPTGNARKMIQGAGYGVELIPVSTIDEALSLGIEE